MGIDVQNTATVAGGIGGTVIGAAFFFRTLISKWVGLGTNIDEEHARRDVVTLLRDQVEELVQLNKELREENHHLMEERLALKEEKSDLRMLVKELEIKVEFLQHSVDNIHK